MFGPAKRPLPQLPITVDDEGYLVAQSDFHEPVGPSFWERSAGVPPPLNLRRAPPLLLSAPPIPRNAPSRRQRRCISTNAQVLPGLSRSLAARRSPITGLFCSVRLPSLVLWLCSLPARSSRFSSKHPWLRRSTSPLRFGVVCLSDRCTTGQRCCLSPRLGCTCFESSSRVRSVNPGN